MHKTRCNALYETNTAQDILPNGNLISDMKQDDSIYFLSWRQRYLDLTDNTDSIALNRSFYKPTSQLLCFVHAPSAFLNIKKLERIFHRKAKQSPSVFTNSEEAAVQLRDIVLSCLKMKEKNAERITKNADWRLSRSRNGLMNHRNNNPQVQS